MGLTESPVHLSSGVVYYSLFADGTILKFLMRDLRQDLSCELLVLKLKSIDRRAPPGVEPVT